MVRLGCAKPKPDIRTGGARPMPAFPFWKQAGRRMPCASHNEPMENTAQFTARDIADMVRHWLATPPNGYLGQPYGCDLKALLQSPLSAGLADGLIAKLHIDVPITKSVSVNVYAYDIEIDKKMIVFEVAGETVQAGAT